MMKKQLICPAQLACMNEHGEITEKVAERHGLDEFDFFRMVKRVIWRGLGINEDDVPRQACGENGVDC